MDGPTEYLSLILAAIEFQVFIFRGSGHLQAIFRFAGWPVTGREQRTPQGCLRAPRSLQLTVKQSDQVTVESYDLQPLSSPLGPVDPSFRALSGLFSFTIRRHKFNKDSLISSPRGGLREAIQHKALQASSQRSF